MGIRRSFIRNRPKTVKTLFDNLVDTVKDLKDLLKEALNKAKDKEIPDEEWIRKIEDLMSSKSIWASFVKQGELFINQNYGGLYPRKDSEIPNPEAIDENYKKMKKSELKSLIKEVVKEKSNLNPNNYPFERHDFLSKALKYYWMLIEPVDNDGMGLSHEDALTQMENDINEYIEENK